MKWALVLALVLCCGSTRGETENDSIESLDKLTEQLEQDLLFRPRTLLAVKLTCGEIECKNGATNCIDGGKCECLAGFTGDDCAQVVCGTNKCKNGAKKCQEEDETKCDCPEETTEDDCSQVTGCVDGLQAICDNLGLKCIYDPQTPKKAACSCTENKKFDGETCKETCDAENDNCFNEAQCEAQNGYNFCTCVPGLTGDLCQNITACETGGTYEKCSSGGGTCKFSGGQATCVCETDKKFDTNSGQCRETCDSENNNCFNEAQCEAQNGYNFCTCVPGLTGDLCQNITACETGGTYEKCSRGGGTCTFSGGQANCACETDKQFDTNSRQCRGTCDSKTKKCENGAKCEDQGGQTFCTCVPGLTGDLCQVITDCGKGKTYENCTDFDRHQCKFSIEEGKAFCECADNKQFDTHKGQCGKTCKDDDQCPSTFRCKPIGGYSFCVCANDFTGYECELIIDCEPSGKYANCTKAGGLCWHNGTKSICDCKGKEYDTQSGTCRATCDPNKSECVNEANCEVQDGKHFCTCVEGLTGDFCNIINECQPSGKYGKCESSGGNCTFSEGNAGCSCGTGKLFDLTEGQCKDACGTVICRNGAQCKDGKCECPTGLSGTDCLTVEGCTEDLEKICKAISSKCIYDSKKEKKASCECTKNNQKFDGETCKDCDCWKNQECFFDEKKEKQCLCIDKFSDNNGNCEQCDCGQNGKCSFVNGEKKCACNDRYKEDEGTCKICDCGKNGDCIFEDHNQTCVCNDGFAELEGKCEECDCGDYGECRFVGKEKKKNCTCDNGYFDKNGTCTEPCETNDDCDQNTNCTETNGVLFCNCMNIFTGHKCEKVVACETGGILQNCEKSGGKCSYNFTQSKADCECNEEKKFDDNLKICRMKCKPEETCKHGGKCQDELCMCPTGTSGDDCSKVDDCDKDLTEKCEEISAKCVYDNTTNNATCECNNDDLKYKDNECTPKWCDSNPCNAKVSECVYGIGSAICNCTESEKYYDYAKKNCIAIYKCPLVPCKENEYCTDDGKCACDKNHVKDNDECKRKELCDSTPSPCSLNATCQEGKSIGTVKCECPSHTYFNPKSKSCEVMIKEEEKCKDETDCGPFGYCVQKRNTSSCACEKNLAVLDKGTGVCILIGKNACLSKEVLSNNNRKCNCSGTLKDSTNGITCEYMTCGDEAAQEDCKSKGAICVNTENSDKQKTYECQCSAGQTLTTDKGCVDACSKFLTKCSNNQQTCYLDEKGTATCKCPPGFAENNTDGEITCQLNVQFSYLLKELPVMKQEFLNKDQFVNKAKLNEYVIKAMKAVSSQSYVFGSIQNFRLSDDVILCDVWLKFNEDAEQDVKRWRSQVVQTNDSTVLPPSLKLSSVKLGNVTYEKLEFCSPTVYKTVCGRQGSECDKDKKACYCTDGYEEVAPSIKVINGNKVLRCEDIDECNENKHTCKANSECKNTMGGYHCECDPGFHKKDQNESAECVELCSANPCNNGDCAVKENRVECSCKSGFKGSYCTESDDKLKQAQHSTKVVGAVLGTILAVTFVAIIAYVVKLKKNSYSEDFSTSPRDNSEMAERPLRGISNRGYQ